MATKLSMMHRDEVVRGSAPQPKGPSEKLSLIIDADADGKRVRLVAKDEIVRVWLFLATGDRLIDNS
jgi:hypothetical protein